MYSTENIRLAYDISFLGLYFSWPDSKTGIYRVSEEILKQLTHRYDFEISLVGLCGEKVGLPSAFSSIGSFGYYKHIKKDDLQLYKDVEFEKTYQSHLHLKWLYEKIYGTYCTKIFQLKNKKSLESIVIRSFVKFLNSTGFTKVDTFRIFNPRKFDIFHSTYFDLPPRGITGSLPRLITVYDLIPLTAQEFNREYSNNTLDKILRSIDPEHDWVVCISEHTRRELCEYLNFPQERTFVTYLAAESKFRSMDDEKYVDKIKEKYCIPTTETYFLSLASHLDPRKNIFHLIRTFVHLIREDSKIEANLVLIGTLRFKRSDVVKAIEEFAEYRHRIIFVGYVPDEDLSAIYSGATAFVFPSLYEGFGLPILEAMQSGTPVISSNATSLPEVAGDAAVLVDPTDEDALCQAMREVLQDDTLQQELRKKGLEQAKKFSWAKCADQTVEIYQHILSQCH